MRKEKPEKARGGSEKMSKKQDKTTSMDIYGLLLDASKKQRRAKREQLLKSIGVKEFFEEGKISVDMKTCKGVECKFCIEVCPTNALFWRAGEIGITEDLCVYCTSCVLNCMVDDCIVVERKRSNGEKERFSKPSDVVTFWERLNTKKRIDALKMILPDGEAFLKRYRRPFFEFEEEKK